MGFFEEGVPTPVWGDVFLASGLAAVGFELWRLWSFGISADLLSQARDAIFFIIAVILFSLGASLKRPRKE